MGTAYEITPRQLDQVGKDRWKGVRTILTHNQNVQWYSRSMYNQVYPGMSGPARRQLRPGPAGKYPGL